MNTKILNVMIFACGAAIGSVVTWKVVKTKYERIAQEEIDSVKEYYANKNAAVIDETEEVEEETVEEKTEESDNTETNVAVGARQAYADVLKDLGYTNENASKATNQRPYVIPLQSFGEFETYTCITLVCYADDVVTDYDSGELLEDAERLIGPNVSDHFGDYPEEPDVVYIRNEQLGIDYEVLRDENNYADLFG